jgi:hypothetical protein
VKADSRRSFGPRPIGWYTLVASTISSRRPEVFSQRPMISSEVPKPFSHVRGLRPAVDVGGVDVVDSMFDRGVQNAVGGLLVRRVAEVHRAQGDPGHQKAGSAEVCVLQSLSSSLVSVLPVGEGHCSPSGAALCATAASWFQLAMIRSRSSDAVPTAAVQIRSVSALSAAGARSSRVSSSLPTNG